MDVTTLTARTTAPLFALVATATNQLTRLTGVTVNGGELAEGIVLTETVYAYGLFRIDHSARSFIARLTTA